MKRFIVLTIFFLLAHGYTDVCTNTDSCFTGLTIESQFYDNGTIASYTIDPDSISCEINSIILAFPTCLGLVSVTSCIEAYGSASTADAFEQSCEDPAAFFDCWYQNDTLTNGTCFSAVGDSYSNHLTIYKFILAENCYTFNLTFDGPSDFDLRPALFAVNDTAAEPTPEELQDINFVFPSPEVCYNCSLRQPYTCLDPPSGGSPGLPTFFDLGPSATCDITDNCLSGLKFVGYSLIAFPNSLIYEVQRSDLTRDPCELIKPLIPVPKNLRITSITCGLPSIIQVSPFNICFYPLSMSYPDYNLWQLLIPQSCFGEFRVTFNDTIDLDRVTWVTSGITAVNEFGTWICVKGCMIPSVYSTYTNTISSECGIGSGCVANSPITTVIATDRIEYTYDHSCSPSDNLRVNLNIALPSEVSIIGSECVLSYGRTTITPCGINVIYSNYDTYYVILNSTCKTFKFQLKGYFNAGTYGSVDFPIYTKLLLDASPGSDVCSFCAVPTILRSVQTITTGSLTTGIITLTTGAITSGALTTGRFQYTTGRTATTGELTTSPPVTTAPLTTGLLSSYTFQSDGCTTDINGCIDSGPISATFFNNRIQYSISHSCPFVTIYVPIPSTLRINGTSCVFALGPVPESAGTGCTLTGTYSGHTLYGVTIQDSCQGFSLSFNNSIDRTKYQILPVPASSENPNSPFNTICVNCSMLVPFKTDFFYTSGAITSSPLTTSPLTTGAITTGQRSFYYNGIGNCQSSNSCLNNTIIRARFYDKSIEYYWDPVNCQDIQFKLFLPSSLTIHSIVGATVIGGSSVFGYCENATYPNFTLYIIKVQFAAVSFSINFDAGDVGFDYSKIVNLESGIFTTDLRVGNFCSVCTIPTLNLNDLVYTTGLFTSSEVTSGISLTTGRRVRFTTGEEVQTTGSIIPDCNNNDIPDEWEIEGHLVKDINGNGVPDECEGLDNQHIYSSTIITWLFLAIILFLISFLTYFVIKPLLTYCLRKIDGTPIDSVVHRKGEDFDSDDEVPELGRRTKSKTREKRK